MEHNNEEYQKGLGRRIKALIKEAGFSIMKFAKLTGISSIQILKWIDGKEKPSDQQLNEILGYTGCKKVDWLRTGDPSSRHLSAQTTESIFFFKTPKVKKNVYHLGYHFTSYARRNVLWVEEVKRKTGGPDLTQVVWDLKYKQSHAINFFYQEIKKFLLLSGGYCVAVVPSSSTHDTDTGIASLGQRLAEDWPGIKDATKILKRKNSREPFSKSSGLRNIDLEYEALLVENPALIKDKNILLLDDNTTTGTSMKACEKRLKDSGAKTILCLALTKTLRPDYSFDGDDY